MKNDIKTLSLESSQSAKTNPIRLYSGGIGHSGKTKPAGAKFI
ncbi:unknown [[Mannheimia] succiniciproducens MBEL55E]|uniref:Uncharacterized protein n=1 Tax=Mannheimia succiniciproducens (strain KCTC 0769BP / MBEL55E) TaxID=221988 RepID=Q65VP1_MANSM|nr:unknown [[Mannheimia] succiniciproducens MBEL55E]